MLVSPAYRTQAASTGGPKHRPCNYEIGRVPLSSNHKLNRSSPIVTLPVHSSLFSLIKTPPTSQKRRKAESKHHTDISFQLTYNDKTSGCKPLEPSRQCEYCYNQKTHAPMRSRNWHVSSSLWSTRNKHFTINWTEWYLSTDAQLESKSKGS